MEKPSTLFPIDLERSPSINHPVNPEFELSAYLLLRIDSGLCHRDSTPMTKHSQLHLSPLAVVEVLTPLQHYADRKQFSAIAILEEIMVKN
jgi:hypothetical protein